MIIMQVLSCLIYLCYRVLGVFILENLAICLEPSQSQDNPSHAIISISQLVAEVRKLSNLSIQYNQAQHPVQTSVVCSN